MRTRDGDTGPNGGEVPEAYGPRREGGSGRLGGGVGAINYRVAQQGSEGEGNNREQRVARKGSLTASKWRVRGHGVGSGKWEVRESVEGKFA